MVSDNKDHKEQRSAYVPTALEWKWHAVGKKGVDSPQVF